MTTPPTKEESRSELHAAIMNLPDGKHGTKWESAENAYKAGHRDARHAAAELVLAAPLSPAGQAVRMLNDAEEHAMWQAWGIGAAEMIAIQRKFCEVNGLTVGQPAGREVSDEQIDAAARSLGISYGGREFDIRSIVRAVLSASAVPVEAGEQALTDAYAEGRRDEQDELSSVLPGTTYMDPPDGGAPTILEQLQRQAKDAARYLWLRNNALRYANVSLGSDAEGGNVVDFNPTLTIPEPAGMAYEDNEWTLTDLDAAIDAAMSLSSSLPQGGE